MVIADDMADGDICATDLLGQAEDGPDRSCVLLTPSAKTVRETMAQVDRLFGRLPRAAHARTRWETYRQVNVCDDLDARLALAKDVALFKGSAFRGSGLAQIKLGRLGQGDGVMGALGCLAFGSAELVTGVSLIVDGGLTADCRISCHE
jgi:hypothetical protein